MNAQRRCDVAFCGILVYFISLFKIWFIGSFVCIFDFRITDLSDPEDRMMAVLEWYLTSFHAGRQVGRALNK